MTGFFKFFSDILKIVYFKNRKNQVISLTPCTFNLQFFSQLYVHHSFVASFDFIVRRIKKENYAKKLCENAFLLKNKPLKTGSILEIIGGKNHSNYSSLSS